MTDSRFRHGDGFSRIPRKIRLLPRDARNAALCALLLVDAGLSSQQALATVFEAMSLPEGGYAAAGKNFSASAKNNAPVLSPVDRGLCSELVYGYLRLEIRIAFILSRVLPRPDSLPRPLLLVLGLAAYGLLFQDRVPDHAAVFSAVATARSLYGQGLSRVANGALRSVQRLGHAPLERAFYARKDAPEGSVAADGLFYSLPAWILVQWREAYGLEAAEALCRRSSERPWSALRVNARHADAERLRSALLACGGLQAGEWGVAFGPGQLPGVALEHPLEVWQRKGALSFQSAGSQLVLEHLGIYGWREPVWDVCAGYGGKTAALLERGVAVRLATDRNAGRLAGLPGQCGRLGLSCPVVVRADAVMPPVSRWDGHLLVDAPCTGLGVLSRRPDIRRRPVAYARELEELQRAMLERLAALLRPGMRLAYVTCTLRPQENERRVDMLAATGLRVVAQWCTPSDHSWLEGMFGAVLQRD